MKPVQVQTAETNGITIAYKEIGTGFPIILINGYASTMDMWSPPVLAALAKQFRIIVFDNRGTGLSSTTDDPFAIPLFASDTLGLMDALGIARAHVLGHSMGACIAQELVLSSPEQIKRVILVSGTCGGVKMIMMQREIWKTLSDKSGTGRDIAKRMFSVIFPKKWLAIHDPWQYCPEVYETTSKESAAKQGDALLSWQGTYDQLPAIRSPTLVITGSEDMVIPPENSRILANRIPGARLEQIPEAGHGLMYQCPERFAGMVLDFLQEKK
jgi:pimeloyl-ACP methyl ester carboxylesterase